MMGRALFGAAVALMLAATAAGLSACAPTPETCKLNQTAVGVAAGAVVGAGLAAALSRGNAGATVGGAAVGALVGGLIGREGDRKCRQYAIQQAMDMAAAAQAIAAQQAAAAQAAAQQQAAADEAAAQANGTPKPKKKKKAAAAAVAAPPPPPPPTYQTVQWANQGSGDSGSITPLASYTDPARPQQVCETFSASDTLDGKDTASSGKACKGPDGTWQVVQ